MSSYGGGYTVLVASGFDPGEFDGADGLEQAAAPFMSQAIAARGNGLGYVHAYSRGGWAVCMVERMLERYPLSALVFLTGTGGCYWVVWLKSVLAVLETARRRSAAVLHVVDEPT